VDVKNLGIARGVFLLQKSLSEADIIHSTRTLADNLAEMALEAVQKDLRGLYHASGSQRISRYEFAQQIAKIFNLNQSLIKPVKMSQLTAWVAKRPRDSSLNTDKIQKQLKTKPLNVTEGLNRMKKEAET